VEEFAAHSLRYRAGSEDALLKGLLYALLDMLPAEQVQANLPDAEWLRARLADCTPARTHDQTGVPAETLLAVARQIADAPSMVILAGEKGAQPPARGRGGGAAARAESANGQPPARGGRLEPDAHRREPAGRAGAGRCAPPCCLATRRSQTPPSRERFEQAWRTPIPSEAGLTTDGILQACLQGEVQMLYVAGADPVREHYEPSLAERALRACEFVIVQDVRMTETARYADLLLPSCPFTEYEGTFTNWERRVQRFWQAHPPQGEAKPDWQVFAELWLRTQRQVPAVQRGRSDARNRRRWFPPSLNVPLRHTKRVRRTTWERAVKGCTRERSLPHKMRRALQG
jgi:anaerobic selenocysteine-containing dehydrogenase